MNSTRISTPCNVNELIEALKQTTASSKVIAGGTDLIISMQKSCVTYDYLLDMSGIDQLNYIKAEDDLILIGANTTFSEIKDNALIKQYACCLSDAAAMVGSTQIRNRATIGGNIANASPAGDSLPPLLVLGASVILIDSKGAIKEEPLEHILLGVGETTLKHDEVIIGVKFPIPGYRYYSTFVKIGSRSTVTIAKLSIAIGLHYHEETGTISDTKVALGAVGKTAMRSVAMETLLNGQKVNAELSDTFTNNISAEIERSISGRSSMPYKKEAVKGLAKQAFNNLFPWLEQDKK